MSGPNVLLVVLDSVRAQNTSLHGYDRETTPFLREFAADAEWYERARSPGAWSLPSHVSTFTGYHVAQHRITGVDDRLSAGHTIFERLADRGYATAVLSDNTWLTEMDSGLPTAFDEVFTSLDLPFPTGLDPYGREFDTVGSFLRAAWDHDETVASLVNGVESKLAWDYPRVHEAVFGDEPAGDRYVDALLDWTANRDKWAACLNLMDAHSPFVPADEHRQWGTNETDHLQDRIDDGVWEFVCGHRDWAQKESLVSSYDDCIRQADAVVERLIEGLRRSGVLDETLVVVTADHGEAFGEQMPGTDGLRLAGHEVGLHEVQTRVPLIVSWPDGRTGEITEPATLTRFPAVVEAAVEGEYASFVPDGPVIASAHGPRCALRRGRVEEHCADPDRFATDARAVYTADPEPTTTLRWGETEVRYTEETEPRLVDEPTVLGVFDGLSDVDVAERGDGLDGVDDAAKRRLERLGYV